MKLNYTTSNGRISAEFDEDTQRGVFKSLAVFQEVFEDTVCKKCGNEHVKFVVRTVDDNEYYELRCTDHINCGARLSFGAHKTGGTLFPKRKDPEGNWLADSGWVKWNRETGKEE